MDAEQLKAILDALTAAGVSKASIPGVLDVEFSGKPVPTVPVQAGGFSLTDPATGKPVNLDDGAPETAQDIDEQIRLANFPRPIPPKTKAA